RRSPEQTRDPAGTHRGGAATSTPATSMRPRGVPAPSWARCRRSASARRRRRARRRRTATRTRPPRPVTSPPSATRSTAVVVVTGRPHRDGPGTPRGAPDRSPTPLAGCRADVSGGDDVDRQRGGDLRVHPHGDGVLARG